MKKQRPHRQPPRRKPVREPAKVRILPSGGPFDSDEVHFDGNKFQLQALVLAVEELRAESVAPEHRDEYLRLSMINEISPAQKARIGELVAGFSAERHAIEARAVPIYKRLLAKEVGVPEADAEESFTQLEKLGLVKSGRHGFVEVDLDYVRRQSTEPPAPEQSELA